MSTYIDHGGFWYWRPKATAPTWFPPHSWRDHTRLNLAQHYHPDQVARIMSGNDHATQVDLARWNGLGRKEAA